MFVLLENVKGLVSHDGGKTLETILLSLQELGYYVNIEVYNSKDFGVPQNRERIFFQCHNIRLLDGVNQTTNSSKQIIEQYLFQLLLNNLKEVQKLQETASKDLVAGLMVLNEIQNAFGLSEKQQSLNETYKNLFQNSPNLFQNQNQQSTTKQESMEGLKNMSVGITTAMDASNSQSKEEVLWQNIDIFLNKLLGEDLSELNISTISTAIKQITELKTYNYSEMQKAIWLATVLLRKLSNPLWNEVLSNLTVIRDNTKYARINDKTEEITITEYRFTHITKNLQDPTRVFIIGHLGGECRREVFFEQESGGKGLEELTKNASQGYRVYSADGIATTQASGAGGVGAKTGLYMVSNFSDREFGFKTTAPTLMSRDYKDPKIVAIPVLTPQARYNKGYSHRKGETSGVLVGHPKYVDGKREVEYKEQDILPTIRATQYKSGDNQPVVAVPVLTPDRIEKRQNGRRFKEDGDPSFTLTAQDKHGIYDGLKIRRLTPTECERLQGYPDGWTEYGKDGQLISDTQRYKTLGNSVTVNVIEAIIKTIIR